MIGLQIFRETAFTLYVKPNEERRGGQDHFAELIVDIAVACQHSMQIYCTQAALLSLGEVAPMLAAAGSVSGLCTIPFAIAILLSMKLLEGCAGGVIERNVSQRAGVFVKQTIRVISEMPGLQSLLTGANKAIHPLCCLALAVAAVASIYFAGAYILGGLSLGYQLLDAVQNFPEIRPLSPGNYEKVKEFMVRLAFFAYMDPLHSPMGWYFLKRVLQRPPVMPSVPELETRELTEMVVDTTSLEIDTKHLRPDNPLKGLPPGFDFAKELKEMHQRVKLDPKVVLAKSYQQIFGAPIKFTKFEDAEAHIATGIRRFIGALQHGSPDQKALVSRAIFQAKQGSQMDQQDSITYFAGVGYLCESGKAGAIDEINAGFGGAGLVSQVEHILRLKRDELYNKLFWAEFIREFPGQFGPGQQADPNNVHTSAAWLFESQATRWALSSYGRTLEEAQGDHGWWSLRFARAVLADEGVKTQLDKSNEAFIKIYNAQLILDTVCEALKPKPKAQLEQDDLAFIKALTSLQLFQRGVNKLPSVNSDEFKDSLDSLQTQVFGAFTRITEWQKTIARALFSLYIEEKQKESSDQRTEKNLEVAAAKIALDLKQDRQKASSLNANLFIKEWFIEWAIRNKKAELTDGDQKIVTAIQTSDAFELAIDALVTGAQKSLQGDELDTAIDESARAICGALEFGLDEFAPVFTSQLIKFVIEKRRLDKVLSTEGVLLNNREGIETVLLEAKAAQLALDFCYDEAYELKPEPVATMLVERGILKQPEAVIEDAPEDLEVAEA